MPEDMDKSFNFYELDGAYFRGKVRQRVGAIAEEVLHGKEWKPYAGDKAKPVTFGDQIKFADLPK